MKVQKSLLSLLFVFFLSVIANPVMAEEAPDQLVTRLSQELIHDIKTDKDLQAGSKARAVALVEAKVVPRFNMPHITQLAVGRSWRQATPAQQKTLQDEFKTLLVRTYSTAMLQYKDQVLNVRPLKAPPGATDVQVRSFVVQQGGPPIDINYSLEKTPEGWKFYDIVVGGASLVVTYRSQFSAEVAKNGIDGLIALLQRQNAAKAEQLQDSPKTAKTGK